MGPPVRRANAAIREHIAIFVLVIDLLIFVMVIIIAIMVIIIMFIIIRTYNRLRHRLCKQKHRHQNKIYPVP